MPGQVGQQLWRIIALYVSTNAGANAGSATNVSGSQRQQLWWRVTLYVSATDATGNVPGQVGQQLWRIIALYVSTTDAVHLRDNDTGSA